MNSGRKSCLHLDHFGPWMIDQITVDVNKCMVEWDVRSAYAFDKTHGMLSSGRVAPNWVRVLLGLFTPTCWSRLRQGLE